MSKSISEEALEAAIAARMPAMLVGAPGTSKTAMINALADEMGYTVIPIILSRMAETDVTGFPTKGEYVDEDSNVARPITEYAPQYWQVETLKKKKVFLFFDEFSNAPPDVRASCLTIMQDRVFPNGDKFPEETVIVGAMNPMDSAADGNELDMATSNRMMFLSWKPSRESWTNGMPDNWGRGVSSANERKWRGLIVRFINEYPASLHNEGTLNNSTEAYGVDQNNSSDMAVLQYAWASRRSWDNLSRALGSLNDRGVTNVNVEDVVMQGIIGHAEANRFRDWLRKNSALDVKGILKDPRAFNGWEGVIQDDANLIMRSAIDSLEWDGDADQVVKNFKNTLTIFEIMYEIERASFAASFMRSLAQSLAPLKKHIPAEAHASLQKETTKVLQKYQPVFEQRKKRKSS